MVFFYFKMDETHLYYRFTIRLDTIKELDHWWNWLVGLDVPCLIARDNKYSLWVLGKEAVGDDIAINKMNRSDANSEMIEGVVCRIHGDWGHLKYGFAYRPKMD